MADEQLKQRIAKLEETVNVLERDLIHDKLTGLKTRGFFEEEAEIYFNVAKNSEDSRDSRRKQWFGFSKISFILFDVDDFKKINDSFGHSAGDEVLKSVAETIKTCVRDGDTVARWGGEEIVVTLVGASEKDAFQKAEEIRNHIENIKFGKFQDLKVTVSGGVASSQAGLSFKETLDKADSALYQAKRTGKNKIVVSSEIPDKSGSL